MTTADSPPALAGTAPVYTRRSGRPGPAELVVLASLGAILRSSRLATGLTLADLEPIAGARGSLDGIERGTVRTRPSRIRALCGALGLDADALLVDFAAVIAPERPEGPTWHPITRPPAPPPPPRRPTGPEPLPADRRAALGADLWGLRVRAGLSRRELARAVGRSRPWVSIAERGLRAIDPEHLEAWLVAVDATPTDRLVLAWRFPGWVTWTADRHDHAIVSALRFPGRDCRPRTGGLDEHQRQDPAFG